jgi:hypothetical protein
MLFSAIASKLLAESLLSLYPVFVKTINLSFGLQLWSRFFTYVAISFIFVDMGFIYKHLFSKNGFVLSLITVLHVYFSYRGFQLLESGVAFVLFYTYPIFILLFAFQSSISASTTFLVVFSNSLLPYFLRFLC